MNRTLSHWLCIFFFSLSLSACANQPSAPEQSAVLAEEEEFPVIPEEEPEIVPARVKSGIEQKMEKAGLVNVQDIDPSISVHLVYATEDNFTGTLLYDSLHLAYLLPHVAGMLANAQQVLKNTHPEWSIIVYDAARPLSAQRKMWDVVKGTPLNIYVSNPAKTGLHNYGAAVDVSLVDASGKAIDMGTPFDFFGPEAHIDKETLLVKNGKLTQQQVENRLILRNAMKAAGFKALRTEWWHFNACTREEARSRYKVIDF
ncbi:MAG: M15 family metallopeptidase [Candidatus Azobacteroides sp.]|nr:M15 family metallopeptidase [Candidatus Azobacteroides sp.]